MIKFYRRFSGGFTLIECLVVLLIVSLVAAVATTKLTGTTGRARQIAAESDLVALRGAWLDPEGGFLKDFRGIPGFSVGYLRVGNLFVATNLYGVVCSVEGIPMGCRVDVEPSAGSGCARAEVFTQWDAEAERGWRGPYIQQATDLFPSADFRRFKGDKTAEDRGFYPELYGLRVPDDFLVRKGGCSIYGFPGEPTLFDPWGNPYVLQIPPAQAFPNDNRKLTDEERFRYARVVSAGSDGILQTPCFGWNGTNQWATTWNERTRRLSRQAGRIDGNDLSGRGDDLVLFLQREDVDEGVQE